MQFLWTLFLGFLLFQRALWRQRMPWMFSAPWRTKKPWSAFPNSRLQSPAPTARVQSRLIQVLNCWRWAQCCCGVASCYFWCLWNYSHSICTCVCVCDYPCVWTPKCTFAYTHKHGTMQMDNPESLCQNHLKSLKHSKTCTLWRDRGTLFVLHPGWGSCKMPGVEYRRA